MPDPIENIFATLKAGTYSDKYLNKFDMTIDSLNPLANVVPSIYDPEFFGGKVCNVICFTKPFGGWDTSAITDAVDRLALGFIRFARYETHIFIDAGATAIVESGYATLDTDILNMMVTYNLAAYNFTYWGALDSATLQQKLELIMRTFYSYEN